MRFFSILLSAYRRSVLSMHALAVEGSVARRTTRKQTRRTQTKTTARRKAGAATARKKTAARSAATKRRRANRGVKPSSAVATAAAIVKGTVAGAVSTIAGKLRRSGAEPDGIELLLQDHDRFRVLLERGAATTGRARKTRRDLLATLIAELNLHELKEEQVLYPALQSHPETRSFVLEGIEEHHVADLVAAELRDVAPGDEAWGAKFEVLKENIEHHLEEEESEMFRAARGILSREEFQALGAQMRKLDASSGRRRL
jgi:hemerythrin-like domain-containing protein